MQFDLQLANPCFERRGYRTGTLEFVPLPAIERSSTVRGNVTISDKPEVMIASDEVLANFDRWLTERFGDWQLPKLFFATKELTGCRVKDVCSLLSVQLREERLRFPADVTKARKARAVPLPCDLFAALDAIKGPNYLWESYPAGLKAALERKSCATHQLKLDFSPTTMVGWIMAIFADYNADHPKAPKLKSHQLRKRAFTASWEKKIDPRKAAIAIGCNVDTMMKHYIALDEQATTDEVFAALTPTLRPMSSHTTGEKVGTQNPLPNGSNQALKTDG